MSDNADHAGDPDNGFSGGTERTPEDVLREAQDYLARASEWPDLPDVSALHRKAYELLLPLTEASLTPDRQVEIFLALMRTQIGLKDLNEALVYGNQALVVALGLADARVRAQALQAMGELQRRRVDFAGAALSYRQSALERERLVARAESVVSVAAARAAELATQEEEGGAARAAQQIVREEEVIVAEERRLLLFVLVRLVGMEVLSGRLDDAERDQRWAAEVASRVPAESLEAKTVRWNQALLLHQCGDLGQALTAAFEALDAYAVEKPSMSRVRLRSVWAEIALDLAESFTSGSPSRKDYLTMAKPGIREMGREARRLGDDCGQQLAELAAARLGRLSGHGTNASVRRMKAVLEQVNLRRPWDTALASQAYTALGRELWARGQAALARWAFVRACELALGQQAPGMCWYARRALLPPS